MMFTGGRLICFTALWCTGTLMLGYAILTEFVPKSDTKVQSSTSENEASTKTFQELLVQSNVAKDIFPFAGPRADITARDDKELDRVPFQKHEVTWCELKERIFPEMRLSPLCNETLRGDLREQGLLPAAGPNGDNTASAHEEEDLELAPFFWNEVTWIELQARIFAEINSSSLCNETLPGELTRFKKSDQSTVNWPGPKTASGDSTLCKFDARSFTYHLPHAMQSIYACWTMWQAQHGHPVLVGPPDHDGFGPAFKDRFLNGLMERMIESFNVTVTTTDKVSQTDLKQAVELKVWGPAWDGRAFFMRREDAWTWTEKILRSENIERRGCNDIVRIGILNRHPGYGRHILNARDIMDQLSSIFGEKVQVDEILFEVKSFREQIDWFASHDIILTSHGAQETGLPFMPKCGGLLEVFPSVYFVPDYFSTLSDSSHVSHYMMCNNQSPDPIADTKESSKSDESLFPAKKTNLCPATANTMDYLLTVIRDWDSCCLKKDRGQ